MVYLVIAYYTITLIITPVFAEKKTRAETPFLMIGAMFKQAVFFTLFLSSYHYPVFCYIPGFFILLVHMVMRHFDDDDFTVKDMVSGYVVGSIAVIFIWYILQKRELGRFFQYWDATRNEEIAVKK